MITIVEKRGPFTIKRVWFKEYYPTKCTLLRLTRVNSPSEYRGACNELSYTPISNLTVSEEELFLATKKTVRNEIRRGEKDGLELFAYDSNDIKKNIGIIDDFESAYHRFADELKNEAVSSAYNRAKINQYINASCFYLTEAKKGSLSVYHAYVYDEDEAALIFSVSDFRDESVDRNLASRANRYLHFQDMLMFKKMGLKIYDWGNISSPDNPNGIDKFKLSFGGVISKKYNILIGCNLVGRVLVWYYRRKRETGRK